MGRQGTHLLPAASPAPRLQHLGAKQGGPAASNHLGPCSTARSSASLAHCPRTLPRQALLLLWSTDSSSSPKPRSSLPAPPLAARGSCNFGERMHLRPTKKYQTAVWEGAANSTQSKLRCCSKVLALTSWINTMLLQPGGPRNASRALGFPRQALKPAGLPARSQLCAAAMLPGTGHRYCTATLPGACKAQR